jgi:hypothetical protein
MGTCLPTFVQLFKGLICIKIKPTFPCRRWKRMMAREHFFLCGHTQSQSIIRNVAINFQILGNRGDVIMSLVVTWMIIHPQAPYSAQTGVR